MLTISRRLALLLGLMLFALPAAAQSLDAAKAAGQIGELPNGYLAAVGSQPAAIQRLVDDINLKRREQYRQIAQKNGTSLAAVEKVVGEKLQSRAKSGEFIADAGGNWRKK
ncbi:MAG: YdbL family protein [Alphaproteobacteria bacterium]